MKHVCLSFSHICGNFIMTYKGGYDDKKNDRCQICKIAATG